VVLLVVSLSQLQLRVRRFDSDPSLHFPFCLAEILASRYLVRFVIMATIPLTIIGVMPGHALMGAFFILDDPIVCCAVLERANT
jgi:hypothetical protein